MTNTNATIMTNANWKPVLPWFVCIVVNHMTSTSIWNLFQCVFPKKVEIARAVSQVKINPRLNEKCRMVSAFNTYIHTYTHTYETYIHTYETFTKIKVLLLEEKLMQNTARSEPRT